MISPNSFSHSFDLFHEKELKSLTIEKLFRKLDIFFSKEIPYEERKYAPRLRAFTFYSYYDNITIFFENLEIWWKIISQKVKAFKNSQISYGETMDEKLFYLKINGTNYHVTFFIITRNRIWVFLSVDPADYVNKIIKYIKKLPKLEYVWFSPETLKNIAKRSGKISGFTARFDPAIGEIKGKGKRTIKLWGLAAEEELEVVEKQLFAKPDRITIAIGKINPGYISFDIDKFGALVTVGGEKNTILHFLNLLEDIEREAKKQKEIFPKAPEFSDFKLGEYTFKRIIPKKPIIIKIPQFLDDEKNALEKLFTDSSRFLGKKYYESKNTIIYRSYHMDTGSIIFVQVNYKRRDLAEIIIMPHFKANINAIYDALDGIIFHVNPESMVEWPHERSSEVYD